MRKSISGLAALAIICAPRIALAHDGTLSAEGFAHGLLHPFTGLDHLLAMLAIGMLAYRMGERAVWLVPLSFMAAMIAGGALGITHALLPASETAIALSLVALGAGVAFKRTVPVPLAAMLAGSFAIFHGHAHGAEIPEAVSGFFYAAGFVTACGLLHLGGIALGAFLAQRGAVARQPLLPLAGGAVSLIGFALLSAAV